MFIKISRLHLMLYLMLHSTGDLGGKNWEMKIIAQSDM